MNIEQWKDEPKHLKNWLRHPIRTYKTWHFFRWMKNEMRQSFFAEIDRQILHGETDRLGVNLRGINPDLEILDEWSDKPINCIHCIDREIELIKTDIDDVWVHIDTDIAPCDGNFMTTKTWAEPYPMPELKMTLHVVHTEPHFYGLNKFCSCLCAKCITDTRCICEDCPCNSQHIEEVPDGNHETET